MSFKINEMNRGQLLDLNYHLRMTEGLGCPETEYRPTGASLCFNCNKCWRIAIQNKLNQGLVSE